MRALGAAAGGLAAARAHAAADALLRVLSGPREVSDSTEIHCDFAPLLHHRQQMRNLLHHAAEARRVRPLHHLVHLAQAQARTITLCFSGVQIGLRSV